MITWALILWINTGWLGDGDNNTITMVPGFTNAAFCEAAGTSARKLVSGTKKEVRYVCVKVH